MSEEKYGLRAWKTKPREVQAAEARDGGGDVGRGHAL